MQLQLHHTYVARVVAQLKAKYQLEYDKFEEQMYTKYMSGKNLNGEHYKTRDEVLSAAFDYSSTISPREITENIAEKNRLMKPLIMLSRYEKAVVLCRHSINGDMLLLNDDDLFALEMI